MYQRSAPPSPGPFPIPEYILHDKTKGIGYIGFG